jgi:hypothetical protein
MAAGHGDIHTILLNGLDQAHQRLGGVLKIAVHHGQNFTSV